MNEIVYHSGTNIWDQSYLATLSIFYDKVWLPAKSTPYHGGYLRFSRPKGSTSQYKLKAVSLSKHQVLVDGEWIKLAKFLNRWEETNKSLFEEGVISRLPAINNADKVTDSWGEFGELSTSIPDIPNKFFGHRPNRSSSDEEEYTIILRDHAAHLLRNDISIPGIYITNTGRQYDYYESLLAHSVFKYYIPKISELNSDEILNVRNEVKDNREGFSAYLQELNAEVINRLTEGDSVENISIYAEDTVRTKLIPVYRQFLRQLGAKRAGFWGNVLEKTSKALEIDSAPTTIKFYADFCKIFGLRGLDIIGLSKEEKSNINQACLFMKKIDKKSI